MTSLPTLIDNKAASAKPEAYTAINIDIKKTLKSWQLSLYSYEWLTPEGVIKPIDEMNEAEAQKRKDVETALNDNAPLEKPILGIGIQDNIEIGSGRAVLLTLAAQGVETLPVHIPKSNESDFKDFLAEVL